MALEVCNIELMTIRSYIKVSNIQSRVYNNIVERAIVYLDAIHLYLRN